MTRRLFSLFFLTLVLGTAGLQVACSDSQSKTASNDTAAEDQDSTDAQSEGETQVAAAESESEPAADEQASEDDAAASNGNGNGKPYDVSCDDDSCSANEAVITGYEKYHAHCHTCHGPNGVGSTFAPSLVDRLEGMNQGEFTGIIANGKKRFDSTTGTYSVMPAWKDNPDVMSNVGQLWAYLKARSDEALPAVTPQPQ